MRGYLPRAPCAARGSWIAVSAGVFLSSLLAGQRVELAPSIGMYIPTGQLIETTVKGYDATVGHRSRVIFGASLTYWASPRLGVEGLWAYSASNLSVTLDSAYLGATADSSGSVMLGSVRVLYEVVSSDSGRLALAVVGGVGVAAHSGASYEFLKAFGGPLSGSTDVGGVVGVSARFPTSPNLKIRVDVEDNIYSAGFTIGGIETAPRLQNDLVMRLGLSFQL